MGTITLPIWALSAAVGLPGFCLIWIIIALVRRRHKVIRTTAENQAARHTVARSTVPSHFRQDLLAQQIDTVFNGLAALIDVERIKLNALLNQNLFPGNPAPQVPPVIESFAADETEASNLGAAGSLVGRQVAEAMTCGQGVDDVAARLGLSHAEVELAMKLNASQSAASHRKLEAVA